MRNPGGHKPAHHFRAGSYRHADHPPRRAANLDYLVKRIFATGEQRIAPGLIENQHRFAFRDVACGKAISLHKAQPLQGKKVL